MRAGLEAFTGDGVAIVMADLSDDPDDLVAYHRLLEAGYDCAFGSRFIRGGRATDYPLPKLILNRLVNAGIRLLFGHGYNDTTNAFKAYRREVIDNVQPLLSQHFNLTVEIPLKAVVRGHSYAIVPIGWRNRATGRVQAQAPGDGQPLPLHRALRVLRVPPQPRRLPPPGPPARPAARALARRLARGPHRSRPRGGCAATSVLSTYYTRVSRCAGVSVASACDDTRACSPPGRRDRAIAAARSLTASTPPDMMRGTAGIR